MAQHDYVIANGTGAAVRSDLNNGLAAIVSNNSGATEPSTTYAYQWWADTTTGLLKIRNAANNAWVTVGTLASANLGLFTSGSTLTAALGSASTPGITFTGDLNTGIYSPAADTIAFAEGGVEAMRIDSSSRLLVGTFIATTGFASIVPQVQLEGTTVDSTRFSIIRNAASAGSAQLFLGKTRSATNGGFTVVSSGDDLGGISFWGADGTDLTQAASITSQVDGTPGADDMPGRLVFSTTADGASSPTERMRIGNDGTVLINRTVAMPSNNVAGLSISSLGTIAIQRGNNAQYMAFYEYSNSALIGSITNNAQTGTAFNTTSDYRLKENVSEILDATSRLKSLKPCRFNFVVAPERSIDGFIAHEVQEVVPEAITGTKDEVDDEGNPVYQGIDQSKLVPLLTAALQETIAKIETLEAKVAALEAS